jgi:rhodanese-related sulfurtransferase
MRSCVAGLRRINTAAPFVWEKISMPGSSSILAETPFSIRNALMRGEIVLIDVREPSEYGAERIHGALLFPLSTFDPTMLPQGGREIVLHCGSGKRSAAALAKCQQARVAVRSHMDGGMMAWKACRLPIISVDPATGAIRDVT